jgi:hypothetical protein
MTQTQGGYLSLMGQRLGWYINILDEIDREDRPTRIRIRPIGW